MWFCAICSAVLDKAGAWKTVQIGDRDEYGLVKVHIREYMGYVWVCPAAEFGEDIKGFTVDGASVELFHRVNQQDFDACERCQPAMGSKV